MKAIINVEIEPLQIPFFVNVTLPQTPSRSAEKVAIPIYQLDLITISTLCLDYQKRLEEYCHSKE